MAASAAAQKVVVVGGGVIGTSVAYHLALRGVNKITLVDKVGIAPAASGKAGGFLALDWNDGGAVGQLARRSFALHEELATTLGATDYRRLTCEAVAVGGGVTGAMSQRKLAAVQWADMGVLGSRTMGDESTIAQVHPRLLCEAFWGECEARGATLRIGAAEKFIRDADSGDARPSSLAHFHAPAAHRRHGTSTNATRAGAVSSLIVDGAPLDADVFVLAAGPWSGGPLGAALGVPTMYGEKYHSVLLRPKRVLSQAVFFQGLGNPEVYPRPDGDVYVTGFPDPPVEVSEAPGEVEVRPDAATRLVDVAAQVSTELVAVYVCSARVHVSRRVRSKLAQVSTELADAPVVHTQSCHLPLAADGNPIIGRSARAPNAYVATGHGCWGIMNGPATGEALAELIVDGQTTHVDLKPFDPARFG